MNKFLGLIFTKKKTKNWITDAERKSRRRQMRMMMRKINDEQKILRRYGKSRRRTDWIIRKQMTNKIGRGRPTNNSFDHEKGRY